MENIPTCRSQRSIVLSVYIYLSSQLGGVGREAKCRAVKHFISKLPPLDFPVLGRIYPIYILVWLFCLFKHGKVFLQVRYHRISDNVISEQFSSLRL